MYINKNTAVNVKNYILFYNPSIIINNGCGFDAIGVSSWLGGFKKASYTKADMGANVYLYSEIDLDFYYK